MSKLNHYVLPGQGSESEVFVEPSLEARRLMRLLGPVVAPADGRGGPFSRFLGMTLVAPFTQLTLFSFDLQAFLYEVFHQKVWARAGHFTFMFLVNLFIMAGLAQFTVSDLAFSLGNPLSWLHGGTVYACFLLVWYFILAAKTGMWAWWGVMVPIMGVLLALGTGWYSVFAAADGGAWYAPTAAWANPWLWTVLSATCVALSHVPEDYLPPRANGTKEWVLLKDYVRAEDRRDGRVLTIGLRLIRLTVVFLSGIADELWASPRLMPYNVLMVMFKLGYRPEVYSTIRGWVDRALESRNPALDFVGIGGGAYLDTGVLRGDGRGHRMDG
jgi:hypothetical protein